MAFVQKNGFASDVNSATVVAGALTSVVTGNTIVVGVAWEVGGTLTSVDDDKGNSYSILDQGSNSDAQALGVAVAANVTGGASVVVTATLSSGSNFRRIVAAEYDGVSASPLDGHDAVYSSSRSSTPTSPAIVTTVNGDTIVGLIEVTEESGVTTAGGGGFVMRTVSGTWGGLNLEDRVQTTAGSVAADWNQTVSQRYDAAVVALKAFVVAGQTVRPDADTTTTGWTSTPLFSKINETSPDGTTITATAS